MDRLCPRCLDTRLRPLRAREGAVERCFRCHGQWINARGGAPLGLLLAKAVARLDGAGGSGRCVQGGHALAPGREHCGACPGPSLRCPLCASRLVPLGLGGQQVDVCVACPGMWLDTHGLAQLMAAMPTPPSGPAPGAAACGRAGRVGEGLADGVLETAVDALLGALESLLD